MPAAEQGPRRGFRVRFWRIPFPPAQHHPRFARERDLARDGRRNVGPVEDLRCRHDRQGGFHAPRKAGSLDRMPSAASDVGGLNFPDGKHLHMNHLDTRQPIL